MPNHSIVAINENEKPKQLTNLQLIEIIEINTKSLSNNTLWKIKTYKNKLSNILNHKIKINFRDQITKTNEMLFQPEALLEKN